LVYNFEYYSLHGDSLALGLEDVFLLLKVVVLDA
jgi:hypothetical protein